MNRNKHTWKAAVSAAMLAVATSATLPMALCVAMALPLFAVEPVALPLALDGDNVVVTVPANTLYDTSCLYLVWGAADCGSEVSAWPVANRIQYSGTLTPAGGTITFDGSGIPAGSIVRAIATSDIRLIGSWVKLETNKYIDTGVKGTEAYGIEIKMRPTGDKSGNYGALASSTRDNFTIGRRNNTLKYYLRYRGYGSSNDIVLPDNTGPHTIKVSNSRGCVSGHLYRRQGHRFLQLQRPCRTVPFLQHPPFRELFAFGGLRLERPRCIHAARRRERT